MAGIIKSNLEKPELFNPNKNWVSGHVNGKAYTKKVSKDLCEDYLKREKNNS